MKQFLVTIVHPIYFANIHP